VNKSGLLVAGIVGAIFGYLVGNFAPFRHPGTVSLQSGTYCCDRIDISQKCVVKTTACPADKPITVLVP